MNGQTVRGKENWIQGVDVMMNACLVLCGIVGRCCASEHQLLSCQQPYVMKLYPCHSVRARGAAAHCLPPVNVP